MTEGGELNICATYCSLRKEVLLSLNADLIRAVPLFENASEGFVNAIVFQFLSQIYLPGDYICKFGEVGNEMYFVIHGAAHATSADGSIIFMILGEGAYFGEIALMSEDSKRTANVVAIDYVECNLLGRAAFETVCKSFPDEAEKILEVAEGRLLKKKESESDMQHSQKMSVAVMKDEEGNLGDVNEDGVRSAEGLEAQEASLNVQHSPKVKAEEGEKTSGQPEASSKVRLGLLSTMKRAVSVSHTKRK